MLVAAPVPTEKMPPRLKRCRPSPRLPPLPLLLPVGVVILRSMVGR